MNTKRLQELAGFKSPKDIQLNENIEISDDKIRNAAIQYENNISTDESPIAHFMEGAMWYREQIKQ